MKIAVLSGKGGTGKTFISVNLAYVSDNSTYIDCDVEEPNGHLFLKPIENNSEEIKVKIPKINNNLCTGCRKCVDFCNFNALAFIKNKVKVYKELCHSCGGCMLLCPEKAIEEEERTIGEIKTGVSGNINTKTGILNIGEASGVPIINNLLKGLFENSQTQNIIIDCPPGSSCLVMESIKDADFCILVTEPTLYGVHNTQLVFELVKMFKKPCGVILNKVSDEAFIARDFCEKNNLHVIAEFPYDSNIAKISSEGELLASKSKDYKEVFHKILKIIMRGVGQ